MDAADVGLGCENFYVPMDVEDGVDGLFFVSDRVYGVEDEPPYGVFSKPIGDYMRCREKRG